MRGGRAPSAGTPPSAAVLLALLPALLCGAPAESRAESGGRGGVGHGASAVHASRVVTVHVTRQRFDPYSPWQRESAESLTLSGVFYGTQLAMTLSGPLEHGVLIEVSKRGESRRYEAEVAHADYASGLALLRIKTPGFSEGLSASHVPVREELTGEFTLARWDGGGELETSSLAYVESDMVDTELGASIHVLKMRGDTARISGGEPVFDTSGMLMGLTRRSLPEDDVVEILSTESIERFNENLRDRRIDGPRYVALSTCPLDDEPDLRGYLQMAEWETGVYVRSVPSSSVFSGVLREGDVLLEIGDHDVDNQGCVETALFGRLPLSYLVGFAPQRRRLELLVLRDGVRTTIPLDMVRKSADPFLVPPRLPDRQPRYLIWGGLLFQELTGEYLESWGDEWWKHADLRLQHVYNERFDSPTAYLRRVVILNRVLPAAVNAGYHDEAQLILESANGRAVRDLDDLSRILTGSNAGLVELRFVGGRRIVLDRQRAEAAGEGILRRYRIPAASHLPEESHPK